MAERAQSLQDTFLNHVRKNKTPLTIFLINGVKLQGIVTWFDNFCVLLRRDGQQIEAMRDRFEDALIQAREAEARARAALEILRGGAR